MSFVIEGVAHEGVRFVSSRPDVDWYECSCGATYGRREWPPRADKRTVREPVRVGPSFEEHVVTVAVDAAQRAAFSEVSQWISDLRELVGEHLAFTGDRSVDLVDESGLHHPLTSALASLESALRNIGEGRQAS